MSLHPERTRGSLQVTEIHLKEMTENVFPIHQDGKQFSGKNRNLVQMTCNLLGKNSDTRDNPTLAKIDKTRNQKFSNTNGTLMMTFHVKFPRSFLDILVLRTDQSFVFSKHCLRSPE